MVLKIVNIFFVELNLFNLKKVANFELDINPVKFTFHSIIPVDNRKTPGD